MRLTRRNALIGLGTAAAGAGVIGGTGAFTSVEADREISVSSAGDSSANVQINVVPVQGLADSTGDSDSVIGLDFNSLNQDAKTTFNNVLEITPQGGNGPYDVTINSAPTNVSFEVGDGGNSLPVNDGATVAFDVIIDLRDGASASEIGTEEEITVSVTQN
ncbi:hypothetical protein HKK80_13295 [Halonotius sp. F2-221B]|uniref:hypothetical protein n=1 Tax=Halonotius sp. F2-221B TaxID=2731620 RepID=UPI00398A6144